MQTFINDCNKLIEELGINPARSNIRDSVVHIELNQAPNAPLIDIHIAPSVDLYKGNYVVHVAYSLSANGRPFHGGTEYNKTKELAEFSIVLRQCLRNVISLQRASNTEYIQSITQKGVLSRD